MDSLQFYEKAALLLLDSLPSEKMGPAKSAALRAVDGGRLLSEELSGRKLSAVPPEELDEALRKLREKVTRLFRKTIQVEEETVSCLLIERRLMDTVPLLTSYDASAGSEVAAAYRTSVAEYSSLAVSLRRRALGLERMDEESFLILWLLREGGALYDIFGADEQDALERTVSALTMEDPASKAVWDTSFRKKAEFETDDIYFDPTGIIYPLIERRFSVFIDSSVVGEDPSSRRENVIAMLRAGGHDVETVHWQGQQMTRIDNQFYRIFPHARKFGISPKEGLRILPVYFKFDE